MPERCIVVLDSKLNEWFEDLARGVGLPKQEALGLALAHYAGCKDAELEAYGSQTLDEFTQEDGELGRQTNVFQHAFASRAAELSVESATP